jgi:hypothetical protein
VTGEQVLYLVGSVLALIGSYFTAKLGAKANTAKVVADKEVGAGQLALNIATRLDNEVRELRRWRSRIQRWWPDHEDWDDSVADELERLDPGALRRIGPAPRIPPEPGDDALGPDPEEPRRTPAL